jgi:hypothetical protein
MQALLRQLPCCSVPRALTSASASTSSSSLPIQGLWGFVWRAGSTADSTAAAAQQQQQQSPSPHQQVLQGPAAAFDYVAVLSIRQ